MPTNKISPVKKFHFLHFLLLLHAFPPLLISFATFLYLPLPPPILISFSFFLPFPSSFTHYFSTFSPSFLPFLHSWFLCFGGVALWLGCVVVCFFPMSLTTLYAMLQMLLLFVFFFSMCVTNYNVLFNAISSCKVLYDNMIMLHSSFLHLLQIKVLLFNATSSCNVFCDVVAFFFSTSTTNYNVFFLWNNELASKKHCKNNSKLNSINEVFFIKFMSLNPH